MQIVSNRVRAAANSSEALRKFYFESRYADQRRDPDICDFTFGNPHEMPLAGLAQAIQRYAVPHNKDWFTYKSNEPEPQAFVASCLTRELSLPFEPADIAPTSGGFAALSVAFRRLLDVGEEAVFPVPGWFNYEPMLLAADAVPRKVSLREDRFDPTCPLLKRRSHRKPASSSSIRPTIRLDASIAVTSLWS